MIRIDEIYYNTFLPGVQDRPLHGIHWFDPFGSVNFDDLRSIPPVPWNNSAVRYLFWDQEPLHKHTVDATLKKFKQMYNGKHNIITSEHNSDMVDYVKNTYDFRPHYYFFHGWASLDWFRGYNRSFLMAPPEQRTIVKTFINPNRIVAGDRQHRLLMFYHILKNQLLDNHISFPAVCPAENIHVQDEVHKLSNIYSDIVPTFSKQTLPINFEGETAHHMHSNQLSLFEQSAESLLYLVTETVAAGRRQHLTEKTFKPICLRMPFVIVGTAHSLEYLRSYGFKTFDHLWDESYDLETNDVARIEKISSLLQQLHTISHKEKQQIFRHAGTVIQHNYQHFYGGNFESVLWKELNGMINDF